MLERVECGSPLLERVECEETIPNSNEPTSQKSESFQPHPDLLCCVRAGCQFIALFCCRYITVSVVHSRSWIRAGPKRFLAPRNVFLRHGDLFNMCRSPVKISSAQRELERACVCRTLFQRVCQHHTGGPRAHHTARANEALYDVARETYLRRVAHGSLSGSLGTQLHSCHSCTCQFCAVFA